ncbi:MAG: phosphoribosylformylglycinamidine synthase subunit PurS [Firmicutes bacterium]|nr:phosphoribosylformylglycinamidine synthase subunit PurS [Bacillota bacterium]
MYKAEIKVMLKPGVLDPQGKAVAGGLSSMGYNQVESVRVGKYIEVFLRADSQADAERQVAEMTHRLLANPVIETYQYTLVPVESEEVS